MASSSVTPSGAIPPEDLRDAQRCLPRRWNGVDAPSGNGASKSKSTGHPQLAEGNRQITYYVQRFAEFILAILPHPQASSGDIVLPPGVSAGVVFTENRMVIPKLGIHELPPAINGKVLSKIVEELDHLANIFSGKHKNQLDELLPGKACAYVRDYSPNAGSTLAVEGSTRLWKAMVRPVLEMVTGRFRPDETGELARNADYFANDLLEPVVETGGKPGDNLLYICDQMLTSCRAKNGDHATRDDHAPNSEAELFHETSGDIAASTGTSDTLDTACGDPPMESDFSYDKLSAGDSMVERAAAIKEKSCAVVTQGVGLPQSHAQEPNNVDEASRRVDDVDGSICCLETEQHSSGVSSDPFGTSGSQAEKKKASRRGLECAQANQQRVLCLPRGSSRWLPCHHFKRIRPSRCPRKPVTKGTAQCLVAAGFVQSDHKTLRCRKMAFRGLNQKTFPQHSAAQSRLINMRRMQRERCFCLKRQHTKHRQQIVCGPSQENRLLLEKHTKPELCCLPASMLEFRWPTKTYPLHHVAQATSQHNLQEAQASIQDTSEAVSGSTEVAQTEPAVEGKLPAFRKQEEFTTQARKRMTGKETSLADSCADAIEQDEMGSLGGDSEATGSSGLGQAVINNPGPVLLSPSLKAGTSERKGKPSPGLSQTSCQDDNVETASPRHPANGVHSTNARQHCGCASSESASSISPALCLRNAKAALQRRLRQLSIVACRPKEEHRSDVRCRQIPSSFGTEIGRPSKPTPSVRLEQEERIDGVYFKDLSPVDRARIVDKIADDFSPQRTRLIAHLLGHEGNEKLNMKRTSNTLGHSEHDLLFCGIHMWFDDNDSPTGRELYDAMVDAGCPKGRIGKYKKPLKLPHDYIGGVSIF